MLRTYDFKSQVFKTLEKDFNDVGVMPTTFELHDVEDISKVVQDVRHICHLFTEMTGERYLDKAYLNLKRLVSKTTINHRIEKVINDIFEHRDFQDTLEMIMIENSEREKSLIKGKWDVEKITYHVATFVINVSIVG